MNEKRIEMLRQFIEESPDDPFNPYALAMEYYEEAPMKSLELLNGLLNDHPGYLPTYFKAAHLLWDFEKWDEADRVFMTGIELAKTQNNTKALQELQSAYQNFEFERE